MQKLRLERPLPLLVGAGDEIYDIRIEFDELLRIWRVAAFRFADGFAGWVTEGRSSKEELLVALATGIEVAEAPQLRLIVHHLVAQGRAEYVEAA